MRRVDQLIDIIRERTRNVNFSTDSNGTVLEGLSDNLILQYLNEAQDHLQAAILSVYPNEFIETQISNIAANTEEYTIDDRLFVNNKIVSVEYSHSGTASDYVVLEQGTFRDRRTYTGYPQLYIRRGNIVMLSPTPQSSQGTLRITYYRELDDLDIRRGQITTRNLSSTAITEITVSISTDDAIALADADYVCGNDRYGNVIMYNIPVDSYNSSSGVISIIDGSYTFDTGEIVNADDYITVGKYTTTHSKLPDNCERYLVLYTQKRILITDESNTSLEEDNELQVVKQDIINSFADESRDVQYIPVLDPF